MEIDACCGAPRGLVERAHQPVSYAGARARAEAFQAEVAPTPSGLAPGAPVDGAVAGGDSGVVRIERHVFLELLSGFFEELASEHMDEFTAGGANAFGARGDRPVRRGGLACTWYNVSQYV